MAARSRAYVDTSALIGFLDGSDSHHALFRRLFADPPPLLTSPLVIAEGHGWFLRRYDSTRALQFMAFVEELTPLDIVAIGGSDTHGATTWLRKFPDQGLTFADALGLELMKRNRIRTCWSTDRHLALAGVRLVIHDSAG
jgi:predicted nucleic acid-binding protein